MHKLSTGLILFSVALMAPSAAHAAVVINEIAWMGTAVSANAEWLELYNTDTTSVSLSGWTVVSSSGAPSISLAGTVAGSGYYLLERTSDATVSGIAADQIYSGALSNAGSTLTLKNASGATEDSVTGGTDWSEIGGDNATKQTPQRTGSVWVTADPTPRAVNATASASTSTAPVASSTDTTVPQVSIGGTALVNTTPLPKPIPKIYIVAGPGRILASGARVPFEARVYDEEGAIREDAHVVWSFGDGDTQTGRSTEHAYRAPGAYLVVIHATTGESSVSSSLTVRVVKPLVEIVSVDEVGITLRNTDTRILDISSWELVGDEKTFYLPRFTALLPGERVTFPSEITGIGTTTSVHLSFPDGKTVASYEQGISVQEVVPQSLTLPSISYETPIVQPISVSRGIPHVEDAIPQGDTNATEPYAKEIIAPSGPAKTGLLGASVGSLSPLLTSPWTVSFLGLLVAAATVLVII